MHRVHTNKKYRCYIFVFLVAFIIFFFDLLFVDGKKTKSLPAYYNKKAGIKELRATHFPSKGAKYIWLVQFYKQNCRKCFAMKSAFSRTAQQIKKNSQAKTKIKLGSFDCSSSTKTPANKKICADHGAIDGLPFPVIVAIKDGATFKYE